MYEKYILKPQLRKECKRELYMKVVKHLFDYLVHALTQENKN